MNDLEC